jgi:hypothetical protein
MSKLLATIGLATALALTAGCGGGGAAQRKVTGTVKWKGEPVAEGTINFIPPDHPGQAVSAKIVNGKFEINLAPGPKRVEVFASRAIGEADPTMGQAPRVSYIPAEYNSQSKLTRDIAGDNRFDFDLPEKE